MVVISDASHIISVERPEVVSAQLTAFLGRFEPDAPTTAFARGLAIRRSVLGDDHVDRSLDRAGTFGMPWQDFITRYAWDEIWGDPTLPRKIRSMLTLAMMVALHREDEFKLHVKPAIGNGVSHRRASRADPAIGRLCGRAGCQRSVPLGARGAGRGAGTMNGCSPAIVEEADG